MTPALRVLDIVVLSALVFALVFLVLILIRQRFILRATGSIPMAMARGSRWQFGVARCDDDELRWYRALGVGTRPSRVWPRDGLTIAGKRPIADAEIAALPPTATVVRCRVEDVRPSGKTTREFDLALSDGAYTGFVSWVESARTPRL